MKETDKTPFMAAANEVMSYKGLSAYLKLSQGTLRHKVMNGKIPFIKIDGAVRFSKKKLTHGWKNTTREQRREKKE